MRFLILSDIHANATALSAALAAVEGRWDRALCLGDLVGYGPDPNEVMDAVRGSRRRSFAAIMTKRRVGKTDAEDFNPVARIAAEWTHSQLTPENLGVSQKPSRRSCADRRPDPRPWRGSG